MADLRAKVGDKGYPLYFTLLKYDGTAFDLTDYTVTFKMWEKGHANVLIASGACVKTAPVTGVCYYLVGATDFVSQGLYEIELELTKVGVVENSFSYILQVDESG